MTDTEKKPNRRDAAKARTRERVVAAARTLFAADGGYAAATIRSIAKEAGMSTGAVFANFEDKAALYREIYEHLPISPEDGRRLAQIVDGLLGEDPPYDAARTLLTALDFPGCPAIEA